MRILTVFYSRTGITKKVANSIAKNLKCEVEEIIDLKKRDGIIGYIIAGKDAVMKRTTLIKKIKKEPDKYDLVLIGTPVWAGAMAPAIRTCISENKKYLKKVAFFCTQGGSGDEKAFKQMSELCEKKPEATLTLTTKEVIKNNYDNKIEEFASKLK